MKATHLSAMSRDAQYLEPSGAPVVTVGVGFDTVATLRLGVNVTDLKAMPKRVVPARNLGWVVISPVTKKIGVAFFVPRSRLARKSVRFIHDSRTRKHKVMRRRRWVTFVHL